MPALTINIGKMFHYFIPDKLQDLVVVLKSFVASPEPGVVISVPLNGMYQRVDQLVQEYRDEFRGQLIAIDLWSATEDVKTILDQLTGQGYDIENDQLILLIRNADYCLRNHNPDILSELIALQRNTTNLKIVFFFESDIFSRENIELLHNTNLYSQVHYFPSLDGLDSERFLKYLINRWNMAKPSQRIIGKISSMFQGHMWLMKHALREYRNNPKMDFNQVCQNPGTKFRLDQIKNSFSIDEVAVLLGSKNVNQSSFNYLSNLGLLKNGKCNIPALLAHMKDSKVRERRLILKNGDIYCQGINLKHTFTDQENQLLKKLLSLKGKVLSKEDIATIIWHRNAEEKYSVWAIEQLVSRLRQKIQDVEIGDDYIKTARGKGYFINTLQET